MSYVALNPSYYRMLQPDSPWHPGAEGWSVAPVPGWGQNPALVGPKRLGVEGLGLDVMTESECGKDRASAFLVGSAFGIIGAGLYCFLFTRK